MSAPEPAAAPPGEAGDLGLRVSYPAASGDSDNTIYLLGALGALAAALVAGLVAYRRRLPGRRPNASG